MGTDPFVKTWWFLEASDGSWLMDADHEVFTRDPNKAMKWPNRQGAATFMQHTVQGRHDLWFRFPADAAKAITEHRFMEAVAETEE